MFTIVCIESQEAQALQYCECSRPLHFTGSGVGLASFFPFPSFPEHAQGNSNSGVFSSPEKQALSIISSASLNISPSGVLFRNAPAKFRQRHVPDPRSGNCTALPAHLTGVFSSRGEGSSTEHCRRRNFAQIVRSAWIPHVLINITKLRNLRTGFGVLCWLRTLRKKPALLRGRSLLAALSLLHLRWR